MRGETIIPAAENLHMNRRGQLCDKFEGRGASRPTRLFCSDVNALEARNFDSLLHSAGSLQSRRFCGFRVESAHPNSGIPKDRPLYELTRLLVAKYQFEAHGGIKERPYLLNKSVPNDKNKALHHLTQESLFLVMKPSERSAYFACPVDRR